MKLWLKIKNIFRRVAPRTRDDKNRYSYKNCYPSTKFGSKVVVYGYNCVSRDLIVDLAKKGKKLYLNVYGSDKYDVFDLILSLLEITTDKGAPFCDISRERLIQACTEVEDIIEVGVLLTDDMCSFGPEIEFDCIALLMEGKDQEDRELHVMNIHLNKPYLFSSRKGIDTKYKSIHIEED